MELDKKIDPIELFQKWFNEAQDKEIRDPNAMQIATVSKNGFPSVRTVLLKDIINRNFVFYTNYESRKSREIFETGKVAICFYWKSINRQVRVVGEIDKIPEKVSDQYFESRSLGSRIGAWASIQSQPLKNRETLLKRVVPLADSVNSDIVLPCDVSNDEDIDNTFNELKKVWPNIDFLVHAIAFSDKDELKGEYIDTSRENFINTMDISVYSFTAIARRASVMMPDGGSLLTLSYYGAEKVMPHYNVMGLAKSALESSVRYLATDLGKDKIRVNSISAGPIKTLAASGIGDFRYILKWNEYNSPMKRNVTLNDVGGSAVYLLSDMSTGVSGETHHVDCGYHVVGMKAIDAPDMTPPKNN